MLDVGKTGSRSEIGGERESQPTSKIQHPTSVLMDTAFFYFFALLVLGGAILTITRRSAIHSNPGHDPLDVADLIQMLRHRLQCRRRFQQRTDGALPRTDIFNIPQRRAQPLPQQSSPHAGAGAINRMQQRSFGGPPARGAIDLQRPP